RTPRLIEQVSRQEGTRCISVARAPTWGHPRPPPAPSPGGRGHDSWTHPSRCVYHSSATIENGWSEYGTGPDRAATTRVSEVVGVTNEIRSRVLEYRALRRAIPGRPTRPSGRSRRLRVGVDRRSRRHPRRLSLRLPL